jgi:peptidoglycan/LPS O-acetylase OafA/YrhL
VIYRKEIDGLRAVAVLAVIFYHAKLGLFAGGFVGVDIFFVISGYLITNILLVELREGRFSIAGFYERRARRIIPALTLMLLVCIPFAWMLLLPRDMASFAASLAGIVFFSSNIVFWRESGYFAADADLKPLLHTWSLALEEQYYLFFPIFLLLLWRLGRKRILVILSMLLLLSLALAEWGSRAKPSATFFLLPTRGWELLVGGLVAIYLSEKPPRNNASWPSEIAGFSGMIMIAIAIFAFDDSTPFPGLFALLPTVGAALVILFASVRGLTGRFLSSKPMVMIGLISYSAYLWHQPLFSFSRHWREQEPDAWAVVLLILLCFVLAYLSWRYVENPFRNRQCFSRGQIFSMSLIASATLGIFGVLGMTSDGFPGRYDARFVRILDASDDINPRRSTCLNGNDVVRDLSLSCVLGNPDRIVGALLGDSHADAISFPLEQSLLQADIGLRSLTYQACPPVLGVYRVNRPDMKCEEINESVFRYIEANGDIRTVVLVARWTAFLEASRFDNQEGGVEGGEPPVFDIVEQAAKMQNPPASRRHLIADRYRETIQKYQAAGKRVILIYPIPEAGFDVPKTMARRFLESKGQREQEQELSTSYAVFVARNQDTFAALDAIPSSQWLVRVKPSEILCNKYVNERCSASLDGVPLYYDDDHLSNSGAELVVPEIMEALQQ